MNAGQPLTAPPSISALPEYAHLVPHLAAAHNTAAVRALLAAGLPIDSRGDHGGTALHWACWKGYADLVKLLIDYNASLDMKDHSYHAPPAGWFHHGTRNCGEPGGDYAEIARLLMLPAHPWKVATRLLETRKWMQSAYAQSDRITQRTSHDKRLRVGLTGRRGGAGCLRFPQRLANS